MLRTRFTSAIQYLLGARQGRHANPLRMRPYPWSRQRFIQEPSPAIVSLAQSVLCLAPDRLGLISEETGCGDQAAGTEVGSRSGHIGRSTGKESVCQRV